MKTIGTLLLTASLAIALSACESRQMRPYGKRRVTNPAKPPGPQKLDECPAAEGTWTLEGNQNVQIDRKEGFLTVFHNDLTEEVVMDGKSRKIKQTVTGAEPEVTGDCRKQLIQITYKFEGRTVTQSWNVDLEKDIIVITETEGTNKKTIQGTRHYSPQTPAQSQSAPGGA